MKTYDVAVVGAGPAGLTAAMYIARSGYSCAVFEQLGVGGQIALTDHLENYPGYMQSTSGFELTQIMLKQAQAFGVEVVYSQVVMASLDTPVKVLELADGQIAEAKVVVLATGARPAKLGVLGEAQYAGRGVSYCATCDGNFFRDKNVCVVGGGDTAVFDAIYLAQICNQVTLLVRGNKLKAQAVYHEKLFGLDNVNVIWQASVISINGNNNSVTSITVATPENPSFDIDSEGIFIAVGVEANSILFEGQLEQIDGFAITTETCATSVDGVFAVGDIRHKALRQVATAVGDGANCAYEVGLYMQANMNNF